MNHPSPMSELSDERLAEIAAGTEGVTPGPWYQTGAPWFRDGTGVLAGSPDGNVAYLIADTDDFALPRDEYEGFPLGDKEADARHLANCDPQTIAALVTELQAARAKLAKYEEAEGNDRLARLRRGEVVTPSATQPVRVSDRERSVLEALATLPDDYCLPFREIEARCNVEPSNVRRVVRSLARKGLTYFQRGLFTEDGDLAGSGYGITEAGRRLAALTQENQQ